VETTPADGSGAAGQQGGAGRSRLAALLDLGLRPASVPPDEMRRIRILSVATLAMIAMGLAYIVDHWFTGLHQLCFAIAVAITGAIANLAVLRATRRPVPCAHVAIALLFGVLSYSSWNSGGFYDASFSWLYVVPICALVLLESRGAVIWAAITLAASLVFWSLPEMGIPVVSRVPVEMQHGQALLNRITAIVSMGLIAASFVSGQRRAERELGRANAELSRETAYVQLLQHAAEAANEATSFEGALQDSVRRICTTMGWVVGHVGVVGEDGRIASSGIAHIPDPGRYEQLRRMTLAATYSPGEGLPGRALDSGRPQVLRDFAKERGLGTRADVARTLGLRSAFAVPVHVNGRVRAVLEFAASHPLPQDDRLVDVFTHVGIQLGRVAERTALQDRLRQSQKMEAVGQLAAGLAHEINNPMSYVRSNLNLLLDEWRQIASKLLPGDADPRPRNALRECEELVEEALEGVERTIAIVRDVREFSHFGGGGEQTWSEESLDELLEGALRVAQPQSSPDVRFERAYGQTPRIRCSPNQMRQVFVNLIVNAVQAVGGAGRIVLATGVAGDEVFVRVEDDGPGMNEETRRRLFDPFFTTKEVGEGTGLGLYVSYEIVKGHGGRIVVRSRPGEGSVFVVGLPLRATGEA